jgi:hypothetical protein
LTTAATISEPAGDAAAWRLVVSGVDLPTRATASIAAVRRVRRAVARMARGQVPPLDQATMICVLRMPGVDRFRPLDWTPAAAAAADGLCDAGIFPGLEHICGPELRGASGARTPGPQLIIRLYAAGVTPPPRVGKHLAGRLEDYADIDGDQMHYTLAARQLHVTDRTVLRWRAVMHGWQAL